MRIRDPQFRLVYSSVRAHTAGPRRIDRVDIWPAKGGGAQVGLAWTDGSSTIFDYRSNERAQSWFERLRQARGWPAAIIHAPRFSI